MGDLARRNRSLSVRLESGTWLQVGPPYEIPTLTAALGLAIEVLNEFPGHAEALAARKDSTR